MSHTQQPPRTTAPRASRRLGIGCTLIAIVLVAGIAAAAILGGPRIADLLAGRNVPLPEMPEDTTSPEAVAALRESADAQLNGYGWVDEEAGIARIPIDRAIALIAEQGLPSGTPPTPTPAPAAEASPEPAAPVDLSNVTYLKDVLPIFEAKCGDCHGAEDPEEQLELTTYRYALIGSQNGPVIVPGDPDASYLVEQIVTGRMPKNRDPLPQHEIDIIIAWIEQGAPEGTAEDAAEDAAEDVAEPSTESEAEASSTVDLTNVSFQNDVLPIFEAKCGDCHGAEDPEEQLELTTYRYALIGSQNGPVIIPGDPDASYLVEQIVTGRMPRRRDPLPQHEIDIIIAWIEQGALDN